MLWTVQFPSKENKSNKKTQCSCYSSVGVVGIHAGGSRSDSAIWPQGDTWVLQRRKACIWSIGTRLTSTRPPSAFDRRRSGVTWEIDWTFIDWRLLWSINNLEVFINWRLKGHQCSTVFQVMIRSVYYQRNAPVCDTCNYRFLSIGEAWLWHKDLCWWHGDPRDQVRRLHLLCSACRLWALAHLPSYWCQIYTHGIGSAKGKPFRFKKEIRESFYIPLYPLSCKNVECENVLTRSINRKLLQMICFPGHIAQRGSHGRWADAVSFSEGRISHCQIHPECYFPLHSLYQVLDAISWPSVICGYHTDGDMVTLTL